MTKSVTSWTLPRGKSRFSKHSLTHTVQINPKCLSKTSPLKISIRTLVFVQFTRMVPASFRYILYIVTLVFSSSPSLTGSLWGTTFAATRHPPLLIELAFTFKSGLLFIRGSWIHDHTKCRTLCCVGCFATSLLLCQLSARVLLVFSVSSLRLLGSFRKQMKNPQEASPIQLCCKIRAWGRRLVDNPWTWQRDNGPETREKGPQTSAHLQLISIEETHT